MYLTPSRTFADQIVERHVSAITRERAVGAERVRRRREMHGHHQRSGAPAGRGTIGLVPAEASERRDQT